MGWAELAVPGLSKPNFLLLPQSQSQSQSQSLFSVSSSPLLPPLPCRPWVSRGRLTQRRQPQLRLSGRRWRAACTRFRRRRGQTPSPPPAAWWASRCARCCAGAGQGRACVRACVLACLLAACLLEGRCWWWWRCCCGAGWGEAACCRKPPAPSALLPTPRGLCLHFLVAFTACIAPCLPAHARLPACLPRQRRCARSAG